MGSLHHQVNLKISLSTPVLLTSPHSSKPQSLFLLSKLQPFPSLRTPHPIPHRSNISPSDVDPTDDLVESLKVPEAWLDPPRALQESEWLRITLHKWLDDEYCPEPSNVEISTVAARSYYESLTAKKTDVAEILLNMVGDLQTISFQESFHGAFSSANAAVQLITSRMDSIQEEKIKLEDS